MIDTSVNNIAKKPSVFGLSCNFISAFLATLAMGMTAVLFPVGLSEVTSNNALIGAILSLETIATFLICFALPFLLKFFGIPAGMIASLVFRFAPLISMLLVNDIRQWSILILAQAIGTNVFLLLNQTWFNANKFDKYSGLWMAIYSTALSMGLALGPIVLNLIDQYESVFIGEFHSIWTYLTFTRIKEVHMIVEAKFLITAFINLLATIPVVFAFRTIPNFKFAGKAGIWKTIFNCKGPMFAIAMSGVSSYGVSAFITIYGLQNGLSLAHAALLLTFFNLGAIILEIPFGWVSDHYDRRYLIVICSFLCIVCAVYLPMVIYNSYQAWALVFIWGGVVGSIYSMAMTHISEQYSGETLISANAGQELMEAIGGTVGITFIGLGMDTLGSDGLSYVIMLASILYFSFALTRYRII